MPPSLPIGQSCKSVSGRVFQSLFDYRGLAGAVSVCASGKLYVLPRPSEVPMYQGSKSTFCGWYVSRFPRGKQVSSYLGLVPREHSSGGKQRMGGISKQGNRLLRFSSRGSSQHRGAL